MNELIFHKIKLDLDKKLCYIDSNPVSLSKNEFNLLKFFLENTDKVFNRREILNGVWTTKVSLRTVDTTVSRLRKRLGEAGRYISTRSGFGYGIENS